MIDPQTLKLAQLEKQHGLPAGLLSAVARTESAWNPDAVSPRGAKGLFQFMPATAKEYGIDPSNPQQAAVGAAKMYSDLLNRYGGDVEKALAAYNWGSGNMQKKGMKNMPKETRDYIKKVTSQLPQYAGAENIQTDAQVQDIPPPPEGFEFEAPPQAIQTEVPSPPPGFDFEAPPSESPQFVPQGDTLTTDPYRAALEQGLQGATFNFSDEIMNRIGALIASKATGEDYSALLNEASKATKQRMGKQVEERPVLSIGSNLAGSVLTGAATGGTKLGKAITSGSIPQRVGKAMLAGAGAGAISGAGAGEAGNRAGSALENAVSSGLISGAIPVAPAAIRGILESGRAAKRGIAARGAEELGQAAAAIKNKASAAYKISRENGAIIKDDVAQKLADRVESYVRKAGKLNDRLHGDTLSVIKDFQDAAKNGNLSLEELDQFRQLFQDAVKRNIAEGRVNADGMLSQRAISAMDAAVSGLGKNSLQKGDETAFSALKDGRKAWAQYRRFSSIQDIVEKAGGDPNKIKSGLMRFMNKKNNLAGWTETEKQALKNAAGTSNIESIFKGLGRFGIEPNNVFLPAVGGGLSAIAGSGGAGAMGVAAGTLTRQLYKLIGRGKADTLLSVLEAGGDPNKINAIIKTLPKNKVNPTMQLIGIKAASSKYMEQ